MLFINGNGGTPHPAPPSSRTTRPPVRIGTAATPAWPTSRRPPPPADAAFEGSTRTAREWSAFLAQAHQLMLERREALPSS
jgi:hypothetical protein